MMTSRNLGPCLVCGAPATGINFTVPTCAPCKAFFRRNAVKLGEFNFICAKDGDCPITSKRRNTCNCCRLAKCFRVGMDKSLIRTAAENASRKQLVQLNKQKREQLIISATTIYHMSRTKSKSLLISDQTLLTNIMTAYGKIYVEKDSQKYLRLSAREYSTAHDFMNQYEKRLELLIEYFKLIPEFNRLSIDDRIHLVRNHCVSTVSINEQFLKKSIHPNLIITLRTVFGNDRGSNLVNTAERIVAYVNDPIQLKLVLIIQILSSDINRYYNDISMDRCYDDTRTIFHGQSIYIELLWRYLLYILPCEEIVVKYFNKLILDLLFIQQSFFSVDQFMYKFTHEIDKMVPLLQNMWPTSS